MGGQLSFPKERLPPTRTVLVTGGNTGLGYESAKHIAMMGARVIIACRSEAKATEAIEQMQAEYKEHQKQKLVYNENVTSLNVEFMPLDLCSMQSTVKFIELYKSRGLPLDVLVCNAGIAFIEKEITADGYEKQFQVNYLGHSLLVLHFLPLLLAAESGDARIIYVSSYAHKFGELKLSNIQAQQSYHRSTFYGNSKSFQIMQMYKLACLVESPTLTVSSLHPGVIQTGISRGFVGSSPLWTVWWKLCQATGVAKDVLVGAANIINAAVNPDLTASKGHNAVYYSDCKPSTPASHTRKKEYQDTLWEYTLLCLQPYLGAELASRLPFPVPHSEHRENAVAEYTKM